MELSDRDYKISILNMSENKSRNLKHRRAQKGRKDRLEK